MSNILKGLLEELDIEETKKLTPHEKFKRSMKRAGYDMDAGAKRLHDLLDKQKKEREEFEKKEKEIKEGPAVDAYMAGKSPAIAHFADKLDKIKEDESMQFAAEITPKISAYTGLEDRKYRGSISEGINKILENPDYGPTDSGYQQGGWRKMNEQEVSEDLRKWFKEKWVRFGPDGKIRGACARGDDSEGKPKCLPQAKAHALGKKGRKYAAAKKRREDPNPERSGPAKNVATKKKSNECIQENMQANYKNYSTQDLLRMIKTIKRDEIGMKIIKAISNELIRRKESVAEGTEQSLQKKIQAKRDALGLAREQRRARGQHQQGQREIKLQAEIDKLSSQLTQIKKQDVAEGWGFDQWGHDTWTDAQKEVARKKKYEMMLSNGKVKRFTAKDDADAKRIAKGHGAKSVIKMKGDLPGNKIAEQGVAEGFGDISGLLSASNLNNSYIITAELAEGGKKKFRVKAQNERVAIEKFKKHHSMAKIINVEEEGVNEGSKYPRNPASYHLKKYPVPPEQMVRPVKKQKVKPNEKPDQKPEEKLDELKCWPGYSRVQGVPAGAPGSCKKKTNEEHQQCPECGGAMYEVSLMNEKKDACYYKVKSRYKVWPSAYASGALVKCRKKGAKNWGSKSKSNEGQIYSTGGGAGEAQRYYTPKDNLGEAKSNILTGIFKANN